MSNDLHRALLSLRSQRAWNDICKSKDIHSLLQWQIIDDWFDLCERYLNEYEIMLKAGHP